MSHAMKSIALWLTINKIWFETVTASSLSLMAIIVSVEQSRTASEQTKLSSLQTQIAEAQALPQFEVAIRQKLNDATSKLDDDLLVVSNRGGPIHDFTADAVCFLKVTTQDAGFAHSEADIPINGYFTASLVVN